MNAQQQNRLNPYTITWFTMLPIKGIVTKRDAKLIGGIRIGSSRGMAEISQHNANKDLAMGRIEKPRGKLGKTYQVYVYTDKQFGMRKYGEPVTYILTSKQAAESFIIH